jgi:hypothetical protein
MAYSIAKAVQKSVAGYTRPGGRASANTTIRKTKGRGNIGNFGNRRNSKLIPSINTGGNFGPLGY